MKIFSHFNQPLDLSKKYCSQERFDFFAPYDSPQIDSRYKLLFAFLTNPKASFLLNLENFLDKEQSYDYTHYINFPIERLNDYLTKSLIPDTKLDYFDVSKTYEKGLAFSNIEMMLKIPSFYEWDIYKILDSKGTTTEEEKIEKNFRLNTFSFDLVSLATGIFNSASKTVSIYSHKDEEKKTSFIKMNKMNPEKPKEEIIHSFKGEYLMMKKTIAINEDNSWFDRYLKMIIETIDQMHILRLLYLQMLIEMAAFQFRNECNVPSFLLKNDFFYFLEKKHVMGLDEKDCENIDRDLRESWLEIIEEKAKNIIKKI